MKSFFPISRDRQRSAPLLIVSQNITFVAKEALEQQRESERVKNEGLSVRWNGTLVSLPLLITSADENIEIS